MIQSILGKTNLLVYKLPFEDGSRSGLFEVLSSDEFLFITQRARLAVREFALNDNSLEFRRELYETDPPIKEPFWGRCF